MIFSNSNLIVANVIKDIDSKIFIINTLVIFRYILL